MNAREVRMTAAEDGQRLDRYLRRLLRDMPLSAIMKQLRSGRIRVDGGKAKPSLRLEAGMVVELRLGAADLGALDRGAERRPAVDSGEKIELRCVYEDEDLLVVDKPSGLAVHAGTGNERRSVVAWLDAAGKGVRTATFAPAPAHRLDRDTSGLCAIGLSPRGLGGLTEALREGRVKKRYVAVVEGRVVADEGTIEEPLAVISAASARAPKAVVAADGKPAKTDYRVLGRGRSHTLLSLRLHTGRTHQIRVHLAHLGHPVTGDRRYGRGDGRGERLMLHAAELEFEHPTTAQKVRCRAPVPREFRALVDG